LKAVELAGTINDDLNARRDSRGDALGAGTRPVGLKIDHQADDAILCLRQFAIPLNRLHQ